MTTKLRHSTKATDAVPVEWTPPRGADRRPGAGVPWDGRPTEVPDVVDQPDARPHVSGWMAVTTLGVAVVTGVGAATTARVGAIALAVLVVGCAIVRAAVEPGPEALSVRSRTVDVLVLGVMAAALVAVATRLPAS